MIRKKMAKKKPLLKNKLTSGKEKSNLVLENENLKLKLRIEKMKNKRLLKEEVGKKLSIEDIKEYFENYVQAEVVDDDLIDLSFESYFATDKEDYEEIEKAIEEATDETDKFSVYVGTDVSGYDYWIKQQEEPNYIHLTLSLKEDIYESDLDDIERAIDTVENQVNEYYDFGMDEYYSEYM